MTYQIKRKAHVVDEIHLEDNGKELTIKVDLQVERILREYNTAWAAIRQAQQKIQDMKTTEDGEEEAMVAMGESIMALFSVLFGTDQTKEILAFYDGAYLEMLGDFVPYISETIVPKIQEAQIALADKYRKWKR